VLDRQSLSLLTEALNRLDSGFSGLPPIDPAMDSARLESVLMETAERLTDNYPYFHPLYAGQMLKPPHPIARLAYALSLWLNPNNHALDGGRATSAMEIEAVAEIARMFGWDTHLGHLCGGGTMANLEALWVAGQLTGRKIVVASEQAHYTHPRITEVLGLPFESIRVNDRAQMDVEALEQRLKRGDVGTVVATLGTTATGSCDLLTAILELKGKYGFRLHCDAAYGGYFKLADNLSSETRAAFDALQHADSIVVDPHKHGLQPYGCGCVLFKDPAVGRIYKHDSPYTYFTSTELHLGEISLECSRPGATAAALWATQRLLPLQSEGEFARGLEAGRKAALALYDLLDSDPRFQPAFEPELDIVVWAINGNHIAGLHGTEVPSYSLPSLRDWVSQRATAVFEECARSDLHLALAKLPARFFFPGQEGLVTCLRSCLMKPEHLDWIDRIWAILDAAAEEVIGPLRAKV
jgi:glutamate/tyrosine decarboxylase-like PLP-dependent enzyme